MKKFLTLLLIICLACAVIGTIKHFSNEKNNNQYKTGDYKYENTIIFYENVKEITAKTKSYNDNEYKILKISFPDELPCYSQDGFGFECSSDGLLKKSDKKSFYDDFERINISKNTIYTVLNQKEYMNKIKKELDDSIKRNYGRTVREYKTPNNRKVIVSQDIIRYKEKGIEKKEYLTRVYYYVKISKSYLEEIMLYFQYKNKPMDTPNEIINSIVDSIKVEDYRFEELNNSNDNEIIIKLNSTYLPKDNRNLTIYLDKSKYSFLSHGKNDAYLYYIDNKALYSDTNNSKTVKLNKINIDNCIGTCIVNATLKLYSTKTKVFTNRIDKTAEDIIKDKYKVIFNKNEDEKIVIDGKEIYCKQNYSDFTYYTYINDYYVYTVTYKQKLSNEYLKELFNYKFE